MAGMYSTAVQPTRDMQPYHKMEYSSSPTPRAYTSRMSDSKDRSMIESADGRSHDASHYQFSFIKEQLSDVRREIADLRQDAEGFRILARRLEVELEKEKISRRKDGEHFLAGLSQFYQALDQERSDRTQSFHAAERDMATRLQSVMSALQEQMTADKNLRLHFDNCFMDCRTAFDKEFVRFEQEMKAIAHKLEKESLDRAGIAGEVPSADKTLRTDLEKDVLACKIEVKELVKEDVLACKIEIKELVKELCISASNSDRAERLALEQRLQKHIGEEVSQLSRDIDRIRSKCKSLQKQAELVVDQPSTQAAPDDSIQQPPQTTRPPAVRLSDSLPAPGGGSRRS